MFEGVLSLGLFPRLPLEVLDLRNVVIVLTLEDLLLDYIFGSFVGVFLEVSLVDLGLVLEVQEGDEVVEEVLVLFKHVGVPEEVHELVELKRFLFDLKEKDAFELHVQLGVVEEGLLKDFQGLLSGDFQV